MTTQFIVRNAVQDEAPTIAQFNINMALETEDLKLNETTVLNGVKAIFKRPALGCYFVAVAKSNEGEKIVGCCMVSFYYCGFA